MTERQYAFLMINFDTPDFIKEIHNKIQDEDLYNENGFGIEDETHVTVAPCLDNDINIEELKKLLKPLKDYSVKINNISLFENDLYDVLKCDVLSNKLHETNKKILEKFPSHSEYKEYHPHITIAYLNKGCGKKYINNNIKNTILIPETFHFSYVKNNNEEEIYFI